MVMKSNCNDFFRRFLLLFNFLVDAVKKINLFSYQCLKANVWGDRIDHYSWYIHMDTCWLITLCIVVYHGTLYSKKLKKNKSQVKFLFVFWSYEKCTEIFYNTYWMVNVISSDGMDRCVKISRTYYKKSKNFLSFKWELNSNGITFVISDTMYVTL